MRNARSTYPTVLFRMDSARPPRSLISQVWGLRGMRMKSYRVLRTAFKAIRRNIMRSILTTLGIMIGISAVITMMEIGKGSSSAIQRTISSMGANTLMILPGTASSGGVTFGSGSVMTLTPQDAEAILKEPTVRAAAPVVRARTQVIYRDRNWVPMYIYGTTYDFLEVRDWTDVDVSSLKRCTTGNTVHLVDNWFANCSGASRLGKTTGQQCNFRDQVLSKRDMMDDQMTF